MANKIVYIGNGTSSSGSKKYSLEVYRDISMESKWSSNYYAGRSTYKVQKNVNANAVKEAIKNIFTWMPGERILLPEFGSKLYSLLYEGITP